MDESDQLLEIDPDNSFKFNKNQANELFNLIVTEDEDLVRLRI